MPRSEVIWCTWEGKRPSKAGPVPSLDKVASGSVCANPKMLSFRDPVSFTAGHLTVCASSRETVLEGNPKRNELWSYISEGVDVFQFFTPFNGRFQGKTTVVTPLPRLSSLMLHHVKGLIHSSRALSRIG